MTMQRKLPSSQDHSTDVLSKLLEQQLSLVNGCLAKLKSPLDLSALLKMKIVLNGITKQLSKFKFELKKLGRIENPEILQKALIENFTEVQKKINLMRVGFAIFERKSNFSESETLVSVLEQYNLTVDDIASGEQIDTSHDEFDYKEVNEFLNVQIKVATTLVIKSDDSKVAIYEALRMQLCATFHLKKILLEISQDIREAFDTIPQHAKGLKKESSFYPPLKNVMDTINFIPLGDFVVASLHLEKNRESFNKFLQDNVDIKALLKKELFDIKDKDIEILAKKIQRARKIVICYMEDYFKFSAIVAEACERRKIETNDLNAMKREMVHAFVNNLKQHPIKTKTSGYSLIMSSEMKLMLKAVDNADFKIENNASSLISNYTENIDLNEIVDFATTQAAGKAKARAVVEHKNSGTKSANAKSGKKKHQKISSAPKPEPVLVEEVEVTEKKREVVVAKPSVEGLFKVDLRAEHLKKLKELVAHQFDESKESKIPNEQLQIAKSMHVNALLFGAMELLEGHKKSKACYRLLRNALVHSKGLIDEVQLIPISDNKELQRLHVEVVKFVRVIIDSIENPTKEPTPCDFYQKAVAHGRQLNTEWREGSRENISSEDVMSYTAHLGAQLLCYNTPVEIPVTELIHDYAFKMILNKFTSYTDYQIAPEYRMVITAERHGKGDSKSILPTVALGLTRQTH